MISNIITALKTIVSSVTSFTELNIVVNPEDNTKRMTNNRYGILAGELSQASGATRHYTVDQTFSILLTKDYVKLHSNDTGKRVALNDLLDLTHEIYKEILRSKAGLPNVIMNIKDLNISEAEYFKNEDTVLITMSFILTYRHII